MADGEATILVPAHPDDILVRIQRGKYCRREMSVSGASYVENPYCVVCLPERLGVRGPDDPPLAVLWSNGSPDA